MRQSLSTARSRLADGIGLSGERTDLTAESVARLHTLGYVAGRAVGADTPLLGPTDLPDPKDMLDVYCRLEEATTLMHRGQSGPAAEILIDVVGEADPNNPWAIQLLTSLLDEDTEARASVIACLESVIRRPEQRGLKAYVPGVLGLALMEDGRWEGAIEALQRSLQIEPNNAAGYRHLGDIYRHLGRHAEAIDSYQRALTLLSTLEKPPDWAKEVHRQLNGQQGRTPAGPP